LEPYLRLFSLVRFFCYELRSFIDLIRILNWNSNFRVFMRIIQIKY